MPVKQENDVATTIFVAKLTKNVRLVHLVTLFSQYGKVLKARVIPQPCNRERNFGFVEMSEADAQNVLTHKLQLDGVFLSIKIATGKPSKRSLKIDEERLMHNKARTYEPDPSCLKLAEPVHKYRKRKHRNTGKDKN